MGKFLPYLLIALIIGAFVYQNNKISELSESLGESSQKITSLENKQSEILSDIDAYKRAKSEYDQKKRELEAENRRIKDELNSKKGREDTIIKNPSAVEKLINDSFKKAADDLSCNTGASERCVK